MKKLILVSLLFFPLVGNTQFFRLEFGPDFLAINQTGTVFNRYFADNWILPNPINRRIWHYGFHVNGFYALNFGSRSFEKFAWGPEVGLGLNKSSTVLSDAWTNSTDLEYKTTFHVPVMLSFRLGTLSTTYKRGCGFAVAGGMEYFYLRTQDEFGNYFIPVIKPSVAVRNLVFSMCFYPVKIRSYYKNEIYFAPRLENSLIRLQLEYGIDIYPKRYRAIRKSRKK